MSLPPSSAPTATGWSDSCRAGFAPAEEWRLSRRTRSLSLTEVRVTDFQSVRDSTEFDIGDVTCLAGKNEAGKTALLQAMYRLRPIVDTEVGYSVTDDYPRRDVADYEYEIEEKKREHAVVGHLTYELDEADATAIANVFGPKAFTSRTLTISKAYEGLTRSLLNFG